MRQDRMHLDCVFSILGDDCCIMLEEMIGADSKTRRLVDEYTKDPVTKKYSLSRENVEFSGYMKDNGYHVIKIKPEHQLVSQLLKDAIPFRFRASLFLGAGIL